MLKDNDYDNEIFSFVRTCANETINIKEKILDIALKVQSKELTDIEKNCIVNMVYDIMLDLSSLQMISDPSMVNPIMTTILDRLGYNLNADTNKNFH